MTLTTKIQQYFTKTLLLSSLALAACASEAEEKLEHKVVIPCVHVIDESQTGIYEIKDKSFSLVHELKDKSHLKVFWSEPIWSPKEETTLFREGTLLYTLKDGHGTKVKNQPPECFSADWSQDAKNIVSICGLNGKLGVYIIPRDGSEPRLLENKLLTYTQIAGHPKKIDVIYTGSKGPTQDVYLLKGNGEQTKIPTPKDVGNCYNGEWLPNGKEFIVYCAKLNTPFITNEQGFKRDIPISKKPEDIIPSINYDHTGDNFAYKLNTKDGSSIEFSDGTSVPLPEHFACGNVSWE